MKSKILAVLLISISLLSCKNEKSTNVANEKVEKDDILKVSFDLIVKKDDNMHLYYTEDGTINFDEKRSIWLPVKGNENIQEVTFSLPQDVLPTHIRVDFGYGKNEAQSDVELKTFKLRYLGKNFEVKDTAIFNYFYPNKENTVIVPGTAILQRKTKDQPSGPVLYPQIPLTEKLKEMIQGIK